LDRHDALVTEVSGGHLDLPHELPRDRVDRGHAKGAQRIGELSRLAKGRHAIVDVDQSEFVSEPDGRVEAHEGPYARAYERLLFIVEEITVPPEPPPQLRRLALHDQIDGGNDGIYVLDLVDVGHIAGEEPEKIRRTAVSLPRMQRNTTSR